MAATWSVRRLFRRLRRPVVRSDEASTQATIQLGDFRINTAERTASLRGQDLRLSSQEFGVLLFLTTHPQRCVTSNTILATSWSGDGLHQTEFLKALLSIRKKLDAVAAGAGTQYLRTEAWLLYRFDPRSSFTT